MNSPEQKNLNFELGNHKIALMADKLYASLNGDHISIDDPIISCNNRSFRYGDGIFETIRLINDKLHLFEKHIERMQAGLDQLKIEYPKKWNVDFFEDEIRTILKKSNVKGNARIRISMFRTSGGYYLPTNNKGEYLVEVKPFSHSNFPLNKKGLSVELFTGVEKPTSIFSNFKTGNALIYVLAAIHADGKKVDDCLILNSKTRVIEGINSNLFLVKNGELLTPPLTDGCVAGVMRAHIMELLEAQGVKVHETPLMLEDLFMGTELFLTDTINGVRWVQKYKSHTYELKKAREICELINKDIGSKCKIV